MKRKGHHLKAKIFANAVTRQLFSEKATATVYNDLLNLTGEIEDVENARKLIYGAIERLEENYNSRSELLKYANGDGETPSKEFERVSDAIAKFLKGDIKRLNRVFQRKEEELAEKRAAAQDSFFPELDFSGGALNEQGGGQDVPNP